MRRFAVASLWISLLALGDSQAQLVPPVQLPPLRPPLQAPDALPDVAGAANGALRELSGVRALRIQRLAREHRAELEQDPHGDLAVRAQVIGIDLAEDALRRALAENFLLLRTQELVELGIRISVLQTPKGWSARRGLKRLRKLDPQGLYDFNHVYLDAGGIHARAMIVASPQGANAGTSLRRRVGLVDGGVDTAHQAFRGVRFRKSGCDGEAIPTAHGTAVAGILISRGSIDEVFAADVYCGLPTGGAIDAVASALGWLARERVAVINVSLVGPRNVLLERMVGALVRRGFIIVAAVGNDGPAAPPLYPAAYEGVIGVTGVDREHRVLIEACRGSHVDFAAVAAGVEAAAQAPGIYAPVRGTSFAAPLVAGLLAPDFQQPDAAVRERELARWGAVASDLGKPGRDDIYGIGELAGDLTAAANSAVN